MIFELAQDFHDAVAAMPRGHPRHRMLELLEEAIRRDIHFIVRRPTTLFQCMWNTCWWYDCPEAAGHYEEPESGWALCEPPWERPGAKLCELVSAWRHRKEVAVPGFLWLRSQRAPSVPLALGQLAVLRGHEGPVTSVVFSLDGQRIASGSADKTVRVWDAQTGAELAVLRGHAEEVSDVSFSPDGRRIASASRDGTLRLWDVTSSAELCCLTRDGASSVAYSLDGARIAGGSANGIVRVWDAQTGAEMAVLRGHAEKVNSVLLSSDGQWVACASGDGTVRIWDVETGANLRCITTHGGRMAFSPDGRQIATCSGVWGGDNTVRVWDAQSGEELAILRGHESAVRAVAYSPDGRHIVSASGGLTGVIVNFGGDYTVRVWDAETGAELRCLHGHESAVRAVAYSPDGHLLVSASGADTTWDDKELRGDNSIRLWDWETGRVSRRLKGHSYLVECVAYSAKNRWVFSTSRDGTIRVWNAETGEETYCLRGHRGPVQCVASSPDGRHIASASGDGTARVWDVETGVELRCLTERGGWMVSVAYSPDGRRIVGGSTINRVFVWDAETGQEINCFFVPDVRAVAYSADGAQIVTRSVGGVLCAWESETGHRRAATIYQDDVWNVMVGTSNTGAQASNVGGETVVECTPGGRLMAWFPEALEHIAMRSAGLAWAGSVLNHVYVVTLEGGDKV